jgi:protein-tyrosine phosphatase
LIKRPHVILDLVIDIHSHIMPGIDDGARTLDEALEMVRIAVEDGVEQIVSTPHMFNGLSRNPEPTEIEDLVAEFNEAVSKASEGRLKILPGNEVRISHEIVAQAQHNRVTRINQRNYMLVEFPQVSVPAAAEELFHGLLCEGVRPVLVHPERNSQIQADPSIVAAFIEQGVLVQVTAMSVTGEFGIAAKTCGDILLRHNCVHFLASDAHRSKTRRPVLSKARAAAAMLIGEQRARALVCENPSTAIRGEALQIEPPIPFAAVGSNRSFFSRLFSR